MKTTSRSKRKLNTPDDTEHDFKEDKKKRLSLAEKKFEKDVQTALQLSSESSASPDNKTKPAIMISRNVIDVDNAVAATKRQTARRSIGNTQRRQNGKATESPNTSQSETSDPDTEDGFSSGNDSDDDFDPGSAQKQKKSTKTNPKRESKESILKTSKKSAIKLTRESTDHTLPRQSSPSPASLVHPTHPTQHSASPATGSSVHPPPPIQHSGSSHDALSEISVQQRLKNPTCSDDQPHPVPHVILKPKLIPCSIKSSSIENSNSLLNRKISAHSVSPLSSPGLRLGLSRKQKVKSLHPTATVIT